MIMDLTKFMSRKFIVALVTIVIIATGLDPALIDKIVVLVMMYLGSQGVVDAVSAHKAKK